MLSFYKAIYWKMLMYCGVGESLDTDLYAGAHEGEVKIYFFMLYFLVSLLYSCL